MEIVALNEQLREEFAGVVKQFLAIRRDEIARVSAAGGGALVFAAVAVPGDQTKSPHPTISGTPAHRDPKALTPNPDAINPKQEEHGRPQPMAEPESEESARSGPSVRAVAENDVSVETPVQPTVVPTAATLLVPERTQQYAALAQSILHRVNMYQYKSRAQFSQDVVQLLALADSPDQQLLVRHLVDQQHALTNGHKTKITSLSSTTSAPQRTKRQKVNGIRVDTIAIPGIQRRGENEWVCNVNLGGHTSTMAMSTSREKTLEEYLSLRKHLQRTPTGMKGLHDLASDLQKTRSAFDDAILTNATKQVKQRLPIPKHFDVAGLAAAFTTTTTAGAATTTMTQATASQETAPSASSASAASTQHTTSSIAGKGKGKGSKTSSRKRELAVIVAPVSGNGGGGTPMTPAAATPELVLSRTPTDKSSRVSYLRLRRLVQMRLCRHLEGREVCARLNDPEIIPNESWTPSGKLERGKVFSYSAKRHLSFSDFVVATLRRSVAACAHLFLTETRESIDSHLLVCDQFSDDVRAQLDANFKEATEKYLSGKLK